MRLRERSTRDVATGHVALTEIHLDDTSVEHTEQGMVLNCNVTGDPVEYLQVEHNLELWYGADLMNELGGDVARMRTLLNEEWNLFWVTPRDNRMLAPTRKWPMR